ncbi:MAG: hypothetical protein JXD19_02805 [Deltaproteobacteria bacterium]|nr:hypothetical protein [Deltaproteobacteria bacterium]
MLGVTTYWEAVLQASALFLCTMTLVYVLRNNSEKKKTGCDAIGGNSDDTYRETALRIMKQSDDAFEAICGTVAKERAALKAFIEGRKRKERGPSYGQRSRSRVRGKEQTRGHIRWSNAEVMDGRHTEVERMARMGFGMETIARKVPIPKGEIALILKLKEKRNGHS